MKMGLPSSPRSRRPKRKVMIRGKDNQRENKLPVSPSPYTGFVFLLIYLAALHSKGNSLS